MVDREPAGDASSERQPNDRGFLDAHSLEKIHGVRDVLFRLVVVIGLLGHSRTDHVEGYAVEMLRVRRDIRSKILQTASGAVKHNQGRVRITASLHKACL